MKRCFDFTREASMLKLCTGTKRRPGCGNELPLTEFYKHRATGRPYLVCKKCINDWQRAKRLARNGCRTCGSKKNLTPLPSGSYYCPDHYFPKTPTLATVSIIDSLWKTTLFSKELWDRRIAEQSGLEQEQDSLTDCRVTN